MCKLVLEIRSELTVAIPTMSLRHVLFFKVTYIYILGLLLFLSSSTCTVASYFLLYKKINKGHTVTLKVTPCRILQVFGSGRLEKYYFMFVKLWHFFSQQVI